MDYPFVSSCSPRPVARTQLLSTRGGKHRHRGTSTLQCTLILKRTRGVALRRPDGATRRPAKRNDEFCPAPCAAPIISDFLGARPSQPAQRASTLLFSLLHPSASRRRNL